MVCVAYVVKLINIFFLCVTCSVDYVFFVCIHYVTEEDWTQRVSKSRCSLLAQRVLELE